MDTAKKKSTEICISLQPCDYEPAALGGWGGGEQLDYTACGGEVFADIGRLHCVAPALLGGKKCLRARTLQSKELWSAVEKRITCVYT